MRHTRTTRPLTLVAIAASALAVGVLIANAGPLDPPAGTPQPTGRTLGEIYDRIDLSLQNADTVLADQGPWQSWTVYPNGREVSAATPTIIDSGSGLLHAAILYAGSEVVLTDGQGQPIAVVSKTNNESLQKMVLNIRYENGVGIIRPPTWEVNFLTFLYRSDTP